MKKLVLTLISVAIALPAVGLSLGDFVAKDSSNSMKLAAKSTSYSEYLVTSTNKANVKAYVNNQGRVYAFTWQKDDPDLSSMLGNKYKDEYAKEYATRSNKFNHHVLDIDDGNLVVKQFGLPGGPFQGYMQVRELSPGK